MNATWFHQPQSRRGRRHLGYAVMVTVVDLRPHTARIRYRQPWDGRVTSRLVKRDKLRLHQERSV